MRLDLQEQEKITDLDHASKVENADSAVQAAEAKLDKKITRKLDWLLLPIVTVIYLLGYLDRVNIGNARVVSLSQAESILERPWV